ncbi:YnbE family lipoprotein [Desulfamplus magnetovallimortis]|nr:YnbE family lipoprotein [Desulfamplus magnetovallimortis]
MAALFCMLPSGCSTKHELEMKPVEVKPIHITIDVNVKVDRALDNFFDDIDQAEEQIIQD